MLIRKEQPTARMGGRPAAVVVGSESFWGNLLKGGMGFLWEGTVSYKGMRPSTAQYVERSTMSPADSCRPVLLGFSMCVSGRVG